MRYALLAILLLPAAASGQSIETDLEGMAELWPTDDRCYQHRWGATANVDLTWGRLTVASYLGMTWWAACDQKIPGNPLNAESGKVLERGHGVQVMLRATEWLSVGAEIRRRAVHHIWRNKAEWRGTTFPHDSSWRGAERRCQNPKQAEKVKPHAEGVCPAIGYWDGAGPVLRLDFNAITLSMTAPVLHWKELTLPSPGLSFSLTAFEGYRPYATIEGDIYDDGVAAQDFEVGYAITPTVSIGIAGGVVSAPGWRDDLRRIGFVIRAD